MVVANAKVRRIAGEVVGEYRVTTEELKEFRLPIYMFTWTRWLLEFGFSFRLDLLYDRPVIGRGIYQ